MHVEFVPATETPEEIYARVFAELKPRSPGPHVTVKFCRFANANSFIRLEEGKLLVRIADVLEGAPSSVMEALAYILLSKLFRREAPAEYTHRYRQYLNRRDIRRSLHLVRQIRGRKFVSGPQGRCHDLEKMFEDLNFRYFHGLMARPLLGWSRRISRVNLGHYDPSHNAIILSRILDRPQTAKLAVEYVLFHEMLHLRFPVEHRGVRRCVHTREFREAEKQFEELTLAKELLKHL
ncbi:MAG TPA: SprT-like domain-containing protein [Bryobacteraceae bacterium]|nr:SprT-like domain-containing protein [Bryobacteraceae bacterium]